MKFIKLLLVLASACVLGYASQVDKPVPAPAHHDVLAGVPAHGYHWARNSISPDINIRYIVTHNNEDSVTKIWLGLTDKVFTTWAAYRPPTVNINFDKIHCEFYTGGCGIPDTHHPTCAANCGTGRATESGVLNVEISNYGATSWASKTTVWPVGGHIDRALVQLNAYYFAANPVSQLYMQAVYCHGVGAAMGLDDNKPGPADGGPDDTCMNDLVMFTTNPPYSVPNAHDISDLGLVYGHLDPLQSGLTIPATGVALPVVIDTLRYPY